MSNGTRRKTQYLCFWKTLNYEYDYLTRKFKPFQFLIFLVLLIGGIITGLSDTQSFFTETAKFIPKDWRTLLNGTVIFILSTAVITIVYVLAWFNEVLKNSKEASDLSNTTRDYLVPLLQTALKKLRTKLRKNFRLSDAIRLSLFVPVRIGVFQWRLQMVCRTDNISERELQALFKLNEGVLGYTFLKSQKHCIQFIDVSNQHNLPSTYIPLSQANSTLINQILKGVLVVAAFQEGSIAGLLAIDTDNPVDIGEMEKYEIHSEALDWIIAKSDVIRLLWRMKNNV